MNQSLHAILIFDDSARFHAQSKHIDSVFGQNEKIVGCQKETLDW